MQSFTLSEVQNAFTTIDGEHGPAEGHQIRETCEFQRGDGIYSFSYLRLPNGPAQTPETLY